jgi:hypothetical protein
VTGKHYVEPIAREKGRQIYAAPTALALAAPALALALTPGHENENENSLEAEEGHEVVEAKHLHHSAQQGGVLEGEHLGKG